MSQVFGYSLYSRIAFVCVASALCLVFAACERSPQIELDHRFSYNLCKTPAWFPGDDYVPSAAEGEILARRGRPDFIRFWWRADGSLIQSSDFSGKQDSIADEISSAKQTWLYVDKKIEVEFKEDGSGYLEHPITEQILLVAELGDPSTKRPLKKTADGGWAEKWEWHAQGVWIDFVDGREVNRGYFSGTGTEIKP